MEENSLSVQAAGEPAGVREVRLSKPINPSDRPRHRAPHCLLTFAQHDDDTDKRHSETHADANQLDHIHCANRFEPRRHTDQIDGTERHA